MDAGALAHKGLETMHTSVACCRIDRVTFHQKALEVLKLNKFGTFDSGESQVKSSHSGGGLDLLQDSRVA